MSIALSLIQPWSCDELADWTGSGLRSADEAMVRITSADFHAKYLSYFYKIRDTCRDRMG